MSKADVIGIDGKRLEEGSTNISETEHYKMYVGSMVIKVEHSGKTKNISCYNVEHKQYGVIEFQGVVLASALKWMWDLEYGAYNVDYADLASRTVAQSEESRGH